MARKDDILMSFLSHRILKEKYNITEDELPNSIREALNSDIPIIKSIALIVDNVERSTPDNTLRNTITQYLNNAAI